MQLTEDEKLEYAKNLRFRRKRMPTPSFSKEKWLEIINDPNFALDRKFFSTPNKKALSKVRDQTIIVAYKKKLSLNKELKEIAIGGLLGDVGMQGYEKNWRLKFSQSAKKHQIYAWHLYDKFYYFSLTPPQAYWRNNNTLALQWTTIGHPDFNQLHSDWYSKSITSTGKIKYTKIIPANFETDYLSDRTVAYWYMDDGYKMSSNGKGIEFATHCFEESEVERLCQSLRNRYGWKVWSKSKDDRKVVAVSGSNYDDFMLKIGPYIHPSMMHKVPPPRSFLKP